MMLVAGALLWLQATQRRTPLIDDGWLIRNASESELEHNVEHKWGSSEMVYYGWPYFAVAKKGWFFLRGTNSGGTYNALYDVPGMIVDAGFVLFIVLAVAFLSESIIRRREGRKP